MQTPLHTACNTDLCQAGLHEKTALPHNATTPRHSHAVLCCATCCALPGQLSSSVALWPVQLNVTVSNHLRDLPELTSSIKYEVVTDATREALTGAWKIWMEETREQQGEGGRVGGREGGA